MRGTGAHDATERHAVVLDRKGLDALVALPTADGRTVVGPTVGDGVVVLAPLDGADLAGGRFEGDGCAACRDGAFLAAVECAEPGATCFTPSSRYRRWLTRRPCAWHDQFDSRGCVGRGRCVTWCPVGIDSTEEVTALAKEAGR